MCDGSVSRVGGWDLCVFPRGCPRLLLVLGGQAGVLHRGRDLGPELLLAGLGAAQGAQQALELVLTARRPHKCLQTFGMSFHFYWSYP